MLFSFENLHRQYLLCRRHKRNTLNALRFEARQEENLLDLQAALVNRTYVPSRSVCFFVRKPKLREIFAADFRDRVVHHVLVDALERIWEPIFIHDSYACRQGKGVHAGVERLTRFIRQITRNGSRPAWYLQLDVRNYFMSIDKQILFDLLAPKIADEDALWLTRVLVFHDCTENFVIKGDATLLEQIPPHKTLFHAPKGKGLPIGNLNSQFFANVYLNGLDQFVKHTLKCRYYLRYCDDFVLLAENPEPLSAWREQIADWLRERLQLQLNPGRQRLRPVSDGVDWLGYIVRGDYRLVRRRVVGNLRDKLQGYQAALVSETGGYRRYSYDPARLAALFATLQSYRGHCGKAHSRRLWLGLWNQHPWLNQYFDLDAGTLTLTRRYLPPNHAWRAAQQYRYYRRQFPDDVLLFQVGCYFEFFEPADQDIADLLGLQPVGPNRRGARFGLPVRHYAPVLRKLLANRLAVAVIDEAPDSIGAVKTRRVTDRFHPTAR